MQFNEQMRIVQIHVIPTSYPLPNLENRLRGQKVDCSDKVTEKMGIKAANIQGQLNERLQLIINVVDDDEKV